MIYYLFLNFIVDMHIKSIYLYINEAIQNITIKQ